MSPTTKLHIHQPEADKRQVEAIRVERVLQKIFVDAGYKLHLKNVDVNLRKKRFTLVGIVGIVEPGKNLEIISGGRVGIGT